MKNIFIFLFVVIAVQLFFIGCDSPTGSKPDVVSKPVLVSPEDHATNIPLTPQFKWTGAADIIQVASNPNFGANDVKHTASISGQYYNMPANVLQRGTTYYWRVGKSNGSTIDWSASIFSFRTIQ